MRRFGELFNRQRPIEIALRIGQRALDTVGFGLELQQRRKLRLAAGAPVIDHECLATARATSAPRSCSTMARARSIPAVIPAEVHTGPSMIKMRSSSTFTFGNRACSSRARFQCVVARRPSSRPASARRTRRGSRGDSPARPEPAAQIRSGQASAVGATAENQCIEICSVERLRRDAYADRGADRPAARTTDARHRPAPPCPCSRIRTPRAREAHHLKAGGDDKTDALHGDPTMS